MIIEYQIATPPHGIEVQLSGKYRYYVAFSCSPFISPVNYAVSLQRYEDSSRSWFRASSFIKLNKNQLDAPLF
jgi:hypothetical protein